MSAHPSDHTFNSEPSARGAAGQPPYELHRAVFTPRVIARQRANFERSIREIASKEQLSNTSLSCLVSAWGCGQPFVRDAMHELAARVRDRLIARGSAMARDLGRPFDASLFVLTQDQDGGTHAHQDLAYRWNRPRDARYAYTTWIALNNCDERSGALRFSGGFRGDRVGPREDFLRDDFVDPATTQQWQRRESVAVAAAGDVVVFDALAWHASSAFVGDGHRMALAIRWRSASGWEDRARIEAPTDDPNTFGMDTSGALLCGAIQASCGIAQPSRAYEETTLQALRRLRLEHAEVTERLTPSAQLALKQLERALELLDAHHARPSAAVWRRVRDHALPELEALTTGGEA